MYCSLLFILFFYVRPSDGGRMEIEMGIYSSIPNYIARKSIFPAFAIWRLFAVAVFTALAVIFWNSTPIVAYICAALAAAALIVIICHIVILRCHTIEFFDGYVIEKWGVFIRNSKKTVFPRITAVSTKRNILGYGNIYIDVVGPAWDINFKAMARPNKLRNFLSYYMLTNTAIDNISNNPYIAATDGLFR